MKQHLNIHCTSCANLKTTPLCKLTSQEQEALNLCKSTRIVKKRQTIFDEEDVARGLHCVQNGKIKLYKTLSDGSVQILRIAGKGELIGYRGLLGDGKYIATAETLEESVICFIPKDEVFQIMQSNFEFNLSLFALIASDISEAENRNIAFANSTTRQRLANTLIMLESHFLSTQDGYINVLLTRDELSSLTGMATETLVRILHNFEEESLIQLEKKQIKILDRYKLLTESGAKK